jgi:hypothetical protein
LPGSLFAAGERELLRRSPLMATMALAALVAQHNIESGDEASLAISILALIGMIVPFRRTRVDPEHLLRILDRQERNVT